MDSTASASKPKTSPHQDADDAAAASSSSSSLTLFSPLKLEADFYETYLKRFNDMPMDQLQEELKGMPPVLINQILCMRIDQDYIQNNLSNKSKLLDLPPSRMDYSYMGPHSDDEQARHEHESTRMNAQFPKPNPTLDATKLKEKDVELLISQVGCSRNDAERALVENDYDIVAAIMALSS